MRRQLKQVVDRPRAAAIWYGEMLVAEENAGWGAFFGFWWVFSAAIAAAILYPGEAHTIEPAFYQVVATVIPVLLVAFFVEFNAITSRIVAQVRQTEALNQDVDKEGRRIFLTGKALSAMVATASASGEVLSLYAVATKETSAFLFAGIVTALIFSGVALLMMSVNRNGPI